jgi:signal transduction histidine kinase
MLGRVTAGEVLERVVEALADMRSPERLLGIILTETLRMLDAQGAYMLWLVGERLALRASAGLLPPGREDGLAVGEGPEGWVAREGEALAVANLARFTRSGSSELGLVGALLAVPMRLRGRVVGVLAATRAVPGRFAESDRWWLSIFAELAAVALENDHLLIRERRRTREAEVLAELATLPTEPLTEFARQLADGVRRLLVVDRAEVLIADASGALRPLGTAGHTDGPGCAAEPPVAPVGGGRPTGEANGPRAKAAGSPTAQQATPVGAPRRGSQGPDSLVAVYLSGEPLLCQDVREYPALASEVGSTGVCSVLAVPLWVGETRRGVVWVGSPAPGAFTADDETFLSLIAARIGLCLGNAELTRQRAEVERAAVEQQAKQDFLSVVSHELKTPVAVIKAYTEVLEGRARRTGSSTEQEILTRIDEQADRMLTLVEQFLDLQRIDVGLMPLEESRFDLAELARGLVRNTQVTTSKHRLRVEARRPVYVRADRQRVEQVLQNLLDNAIKYSPAGGQVVVRVEKAPPSEGAAPMALVSVRDQGIGMSAEARARAFDRFYQAGTAPVKGHVGLGLGLYISREIVTRHGGRMWAESEGADQGSTFYFTLPLARRQSDGPADDAGHDDEAPEP